MLDATPVFRTEEFKSIAPVYDEMRRRTVLQRCNVPRDLATILRRLVPPAWSGYQDVVDLVTDEPARIGELVHAAIHGLPRSNTAIDAALGIVPDTELQGIADECVAALRQGADPRKSQAASLVAHLSLQAPMTLRGHLPELWRIDPNEGTYYRELPWRGATTREDVQWLLERFAERPQDRDRAFRCLLESRTDHGVAAAVACIGRGIDDDARTAGLFLGIGIERRGSRAARLFHGTTRHVVFPEGFLRRPQWVRVNGTFVNPTWHLQAQDAGTGRFGGSVPSSCAVCEQSLHRLIALDPSTSRSIGAGDSIEFVTCLACVGWSAPGLFFDHRADVRPLEQGLARQAPEFPAPPLPETTVTFVETPARWRLQEWGTSNSRENLNRLGGEPTWIQDAEFPACPTCQNTMTFVAQLDSLDFANQREWLWGSGGILYIHWCATCRVSGTFWQCT